MGMIITNVLSCNWPFHQNQQSSVSRLLLPCGVSGASDGESAAILLPHNVSFWLIQVIQRSSTDELQL